MITHKIPANALTVHYVLQAEPPVTVVYHIWQSGGGWIWDAEGNSDVAPTMNDALTAARRWIKDGQ